MTRPYALVLLVTGCAAHPYLDETRARIADHRADIRCGPVGFRRASLGARWGEFIRLRVTSPTPVSGTVRLHVAGRPAAPQRFEVVKGSDTAQLVLEETWENELLSVPWGLAPDVVLDFTVTDLANTTGDCAGVAFSIEQGRFTPRDEQAWHAELLRRGGPDVEAWHRAQTEAKPTGTAVASARAKPTSRASSTNDWSPWVKEDAAEPSTWTEWPLAKRLAMAPEGTPLARGAWVVLATQSDDVLRTGHETARHFGVEPPKTPAALAALFTQLRFDLESEDAAVLAFFAGLGPTHTALRRARAARVAVTLESLVRFFPAHLRAGTDAASEALGFATAYSLGWPVAAHVRVSSHFGLRTHPTLGGTRLHTGVDLSVPTGTPVMAVADGVVVRAGEDAVSGRYLVIDHGRGVTTAYCHNSKVHVIEGQFVTRGFLVSSSGNTGRSTGPHLHYQLELRRRPMDPTLFRQQRVSPVLLSEVTRSGRFGSR